jgi:predicted Zn finger-like uncharacterized protein
MKFLCENCKAKYQIADDKVAGRTVRMKCRKCGHMIEVEASVTETSVAAKIPTEDGPKASTGVSPTQGAVQAAASGTPPLRPPPRPTTGAVPMRPGNAPTPAPLVRPTPQPDAAPDSALAGAFSKAVAAPPKEDPSSVSAAMAVLSSSSSTEEWYVGINGVPVGPVRLSELRRKAAGGAVTEDSLVWREGFEEWVPLRTFPELLAMLKESASSGRTSLTPAPPTAAPAPRSLGPPVGARTPTPAPAVRPSPVMPTPRPAIAASATARSNVVPITSRRATAEKIEGALDEDIKFESEPAPAPAPAPAPSSESSPLPSFETTTAAPGPTQEVRHSRIAERIAESRRAHPALWIIAVLVGILVGMGVMILLLPNATNKPAVAQAPTPTVSAAAPASSSPTAAAAENEGTTTIGPIEVSGAVAKGSSGGTKGAKVTDTTTAGGPAAPLSTSLTGLGGLVGGPSGPSGGSSQGSSGGNQLATADLERVVQSHRAFVKRQCWDSALSARAPNSPSSARVSANITVARDGNVQSVNTSGGDGYPGLSSCVQSQVRSWKFPASDGSTTFTVPFVFAAQ